MAQKFVKKSNSTGNKLMGENKIVIAGRLDFSQKVKVFKKFLLLILPLILIPLLELAIYFLRPLL